MISCVIDATELRKVATIDIPGAFMQAGMDELIYVKLEGPIPDALIQLYPELYNNYMTVERGKTVIYAALSKALQGTVRYSLLFWRYLTKYLEE